MTSDVCQTFGNLLAGYRVRSCVMALFTFLGPYPPTPYGDSIHPFWSIVVDVPKSQEVSETRKK